MTSQPVLYRTLENEGSQREVIFKRKSKYPIKYAEIQHRVDVSVTGRLLKLAKKAVQESQASINSPRLRSKIYAHDDEDEVNYNQVSRIIKTISLDSDEESPRPPIFEMSSKEQLCGWDNVLQHRLEPQPRDPAEKVGKKKQRKSRMIDSSTQN